MPNLGENIIIMFVNKIIDSVCVHEYFLNLRELIQFPVMNKEQYEHFTLA